MPTWTDDVTYTSADHPNWWDVIGWIRLAIKTWKGNVDAAGYKLINAADVLDGSGNSLVYRTSASFQFSQTPAYTLTAGAAITVNLSPWPDGITSASVGVHSLYITGGTSELVLIDAVSPGVSITFTPGHNHTSGAWVLNSATSGIQEAAIASGTGGAVYLPKGSHHCLATVTLPNGCSVFGDGPGGTFVLQDFAAGDLIYSTGAYSIVLRDFLTSASVTVTSGYAIHLVGYSAVVEDITIVGLPKGGIKIENGPQSAISNILIGAYSGFGIELYLSDATITGYRCSTTVATAYAMYVNASYIVMSNHYLQNGAIGGSGRAILFENASGESVISNGETDGWGVHYQVSGPGPLLRIGFSNLTLTGGTGTSPQAFYLGANAGSISINAIRAVGMGGTVVQIDGANSVSLDGVDIYDCSTSGSIGVRIGYPTASKAVSVKNSRIGYSYTGAVDANMGLAVQVVATACDVVAIAGNTLGGTMPLSIQATTTSPEMVVENNLGVDNVRPTLTSGTTVTLSDGQTNSVFFVSGNTAITTLAAAYAGMLWDGRKITLIFTHATPAGVGTGGNIAAAIAPAQNRGVTLVWDKAAGKWFPTQ